MAWICRQKRQLLPIGLQYRLLVQAWTCLVIAYQPSWIHEPMGEASMRRATSNARCAYSTHRSVTLTLQLFLDPTQSYGRSCCCWKGALRNALRLATTSTMMLPALTWQMPEQRRHCCCCYCCHSPPSDAQNAPRATIDISGESSSSGRRSLPARSSLPGVS